MKHAAVILLALLCTSKEGQAQEPLSLEAVLESARRHHPRIAAALADQQASQAELLMANGGFDPQLDIYSSLRKGGYYDLVHLNAELRQPTPIWGTELWAGYRLGLGTQDDRYPTYYADETLDQGELRAGIRIPLWRNRAMDQRRAAQQSAEQRLQAATARMQATRIDLIRLATDAYFAWVAAGRRVSVAEELHQLAVDRQKWIQARAKAGAIAPVEVLEAERALLQRKAALVAARRELQQASLVLALFLREDTGAPKRPADAALPAQLKPPRELPSDPTRAIELAQHCHPQLRAWRADLRAAEANVRLAEGQNGPRLDIQGQVSRDMGEGSVTLPGTVLEGGLAFSMPLAMRQPRGAVQTAKARVVALKQEIKFRQESLRTQILDAVSAFAAARKQLSVASHLTQNTRALAEAERSRFAAGAAELFMVNLREQSIGEAELGLVGSVRDAWQARAQWDFLTTCQEPPTSQAKDLGD